MPKRKELTSALYFQCECRVYLTYLTTTFISIRYIRKQEFVPDLGINVLKDYLSLFYNEFMN